MADNSNSNGSSFTASVLGALATVAVFALLVIMVYGLKSEDAVVPTSGADLPPTGSSLKAKDVEVLNSYGWVDKEKGVVRIPAERARELIIRELNQ